MTRNFKDLPHAGVRHLVPYKPGKSIEELAREKGLTDIIKLASNENPLGCSPKALRAIHDASRHLIATYPSPINHDLMPKLARHLNLTTDQIFLSNGSDYIYSMLLNCFALHQDKHILTHDYAFSTYVIQANSFNIPAHSVKVNPDWSVNIDALIEAVTPRTALIFIANPNNPTGLLIPPGDIKRLLEHLPQTTILVLDEAYYEYAQEFFSINSIDWLAEHKNLVITRTFSKLYGLAGLRLGYAMAHPEIIELLRRVQLPFAVNQIAMQAAHAALDDTAFVELTLATNRQGMDLMSQGLSELGFEFFPSSCNFLTVNCKEDSMKLYQYLLNRGIIVRPLHPYQMNHYLRITIGTENQNLRLLDALRDYA